jgi:hypothetical protein
MSSEFERCIEKAKIVAFQKGPSVVSKEVKSATGSVWIIQGHSVILRLD